MKMRNSSQDNSDLRLMELAARNPSLGGRDLLLEIIERGPAREVNEPPNPRDVRVALRLSSLDDPDYRSPIEHADWLGRESRMMRDLYERGAKVYGDVLIIPAEAHELADDHEVPFITTLSYAQKRVTNVEQAREFHSLAHTIAGKTADVRMQITVFKHYYDQIERGARQDREKRMKNVLNEMRPLAGEMEKRETMGSTEINGEADSHEVESARDRMNIVARKVNLRDESLRFPAGLDFQTRERIVSRTLPEIDRRLEGGISREAISHAIENTIFGSESNQLSNRKLEERIGIAGFLKSYVNQRLRDPETRALNTSPLFRDARTAIIETTSLEELGRVAAEILRVNEQRSEKMRQHFAEPGTYPPPKVLPLTLHERTLLFNGRAPDHHTVEMRELRLSYGLSRRERLDRVAHLRDGRIEPSDALRSALHELDSRQTPKAVAHFQAGILNETMEKPGAINLHRLQQQLPPHERTFLFERSQERKKLFAQPDHGKIENERRAHNERGPGQAPKESRSFQEYLAAMGQIERRLLNEVVARQSGHSDRAMQYLSITEARDRVSQQTRDEIRMQARNLAWDRLLPKELFERNPLPEALRISETISHIQENFQDRARIAQNARDDFIADKVTAVKRTKPEEESMRGSENERKEFVREVIESLSPSDASKLAALNHYAAQMREKIYQGFEILDAQRHELDLKRVQRSELVGAGRHIEPVPIFQQSPFSGSPLKWQFDSLRDLLPADVNPPWSEEREREELQHER